MKTPNYTVKLLKLFLYKLILFKLLLLFIQIIIISLKIYDIKVPKLCTYAAKVISLFQTWNFHNGG